MNCCDKQGNCTAVNNVSECKHHKIRKWERFNISCIFTKQTGVDSYKCTNQDAREEDGA